MSANSRTAADLASRPGSLPATKLSAGRRMLLQLGVAFLILLAGEAALRIWAGFFRHSYQRYDSELGMIALLPNFDENRWDGRIHIDSQGFRGPEMSRIKPPGTFRIITIGDSATFGLAGEDCPYPRVLERLLRSGRGPSYEVVNAGVEGYDSENTGQLLERKLLKYQPDLITIYIGWNDLVKRDQSEAGASESRQWLAYRTYDVYLIRFWRKVVYAYLRPLLLHVDTQLAPSEEAAYSHYVPLVFKRNLERMVDVAKSHGIRTVLFTLPSPLKPEMAPEEIRKLYFPHYTYNLKRFAIIHDRYNDAIRETGRAAGVPVIDLAARLADRGRLFMDTSHPTCEGHVAVGQEIYAGLVGLKVLPPGTQGGSS